jgi:hypothetical protein
MKWPIKAVTITNKEIAGKPTFVISFKTAFCPFQDFSKSNMCQISALG